MSLPSPARVAIRHLARRREVDLVDELHRFVEWVGGRWESRSGAYRGEPWFEAAVREGLMPVRLELHRNWQSALRELAQSGLVKLVKYEWEEDGRTRQGTAARLTPTGFRVDDSAQEALREPDVNPFGMTEKGYVKARVKQLVRRGGHLAMEHRQYRDQAEREYREWEDRARRSAPVWERHQEAIRG